METAGGIASPISSTELLEKYGSEPYNSIYTIAELWCKLTHPWYYTNSPKLGELRQIMLRIDKEMVL